MYGGTQRFKRASQPVPRLRYEKKLKPLPSKYRLLIPSSETDKHSIEVKLVKDILIRDGLYMEIQKSIQKNDIVSILLLLYYYYL